MKLITRIVIVLFCFILWHISALAQSADYLAASRQANDDAKTLKCKRNKERNVWISDGNIIHVFMYEDGNLLIGGYPTTATEKDVFQFHLYVRSENKDRYLLEYTGNYTPVLNIISSNTAPQPSSEALTMAAEEGHNVINRVDFAVLGPFTDNLVITLKHITSPISSTLISTTIQISKIIHVSVGSGIVYSSLRNPSNIKTSVKQNGDTTLLADDPNGKGILTLFATYYPWGRNSLLMPEWNFKDRFGIVVGTTIGAGSNNFQSILLGGQYDFSIGGSIVAGVHLGRRQSIYNVDYNDFKFGETKFSGSLSEKLYMAWDFGYFIGVQMDSRIFRQLFPK